MAHPECTGRNRSHDIIDVTYLQKMGKVRREIVRDPALLHGSERAEATGCEGYPHPFIVESVPQCGLAAERMADHSQAPGIHAVVASEHIQRLEHVEEVLGGQARAVQETVCEEERFPLPALGGRIPQRERRPGVALFKAEMIWAKNDVAPSAKFNPIVVHVLAREARRL